MSYAISWPCELSHHLQQKLLAISTPLKNTATLTQFALNAIAKPNDVSRWGIAYISEGVISICFDNDQVQTQNSVILGQGAWIDSEMMIYALQMGGFIEEIEPLKYLWFRKEQLLSISEQNHEGYKLLHHSKKTLRQQWLQAQHISQHVRDVRVAYLLHELARQTSTVLGAKPLLLLSQDQLAIMTGLSRPRVNEVLKKFNSDGIISQARGRIYIEDNVQLAAYLPPHIHLAHKYN
ncbi:helix-turn-helix domain-containing protein [Vibrio astriarenae]|uniref:Helix-turn-helix domain-containing protein n=1 Tax=Vibrio astriarenae TaxID=1481923 RepID=A0A7Z2T3R6_9VIBR|nr:Crp/Fnr family transcriptional regulator [Vibrio astriarenae]QIA63715.1 helix-turn-helix domain-containing protein [Vibrio astriarenae]